MTNRVSIALASAVSLALGAVLLALIVAYVLGADFLAACRSAHPASKIGHV